MNNSSHSHGLSFPEILNSKINPFISIFGILGNISTILIMAIGCLYSGLRKREVTAYWGFVLLAFSDLLVCISILPRGFIKEHIVCVESGSFTEFYQLYGYAIGNIFIMCSTWITVVMAAVRFVIVCFPFRAKEMITSKRLHICNGTAILFSVAVGLPGSY